MVPMQINCKRAGGPVTIGEVAKPASVSVGTVSRVLNSHENITADNTSKGCEVVTSPDYERNRSAEMLVSHHQGSRISTGTIGLAFTNMGGTWVDHPLVAHYTLGTEQAGREKGFHARVELCGLGETLPRCVRDGKVDGFLVKTTRAVPEFMAQMPVNFPAVSIGFNDPNSPTRQVAPDDRGAGWAATEYLWQLDHRWIAFICGDVLYPMMRAHAYTDTRATCTPSMCLISREFSLARRPSRKSRSRSSHPPIW